MNYIKENINPTYPLKPVNPAFPLDKDDDRMRVHNNLNEIQDTSKGHFSVAFWQGLWYNISVLRKGE